jgi:two-component system, LytTR family, sensor kinase
MKPVQPNRIEWLSFFVLMPFISTIKCYIILEITWWEKPSLLLTAILPVLIMALVPWYLDVVSSRIIHERLAALHQTGKRILVIVVKQFFIILLSVSLIFLTVKTFNPSIFVPTIEKFVLCMAVGLTFTYIAVIMWEGNYFFTQWKENLREKEKYEFLSLQGEFEALKSQVNPHFLFNCFNTLSSLISEDKHQAEVFLNELSKVYRYLLRNNEDGMSTLQSEMQFIHSYFNLLKTRHGDAIALQVDIDKRYENYVLPSLSLQLLVENAVKHNSLSKNFPLTIEIFTTVGNKLVVNNNIRPRTQHAPSGKVGLKNIRSKYALIKQPGFQVIEDGKSFTVVLPLIWMNNTEQKKSQYTQSVS